MFTGNRLGRPSPNFPTLAKIGLAITVAALSAVFGQSSTADAAASHWSVTPSSNPGSGVNELVAVTCLTSTSCIAVGDYGQPLVESWDGSNWSVIPSPGPSGGGLEGISCSAPDFCMAVGYASDASTLAEAWNGSAWSIVPSPNPGATYNSLGSVSCTSSTFCMAVGSDQSGEDASQNLTETWNGASWAVVPSPDPNGGDGLLASVSCTSSTSCVAVGESTPADWFEAVILSWNGATWSYSPSPETGNGPSSLFGVSCTSSNACTAVGYHFKNQRTPPRTLIESWNGTNWSIRPSPNPKGAVIQLGGVSCTSSTRCVAVGVFSTDDFNTGQSFIESLKGKKWRLMANPNPGTSDTGLWSVSCVATTSDCEAVGAFSDDGTNYQTLVETNS